MIPLKDNVPTRTFPVVTVGLIVANALVWFWELGGRGVDYHVVKEGYYPCSLHGPCGNIVEDALGKVRFLLWYLAAGVAAMALQTFVTLQFGSVRDASIPNIGASGAIAGVLGAYFLLLPRARVLTVIFFGFIFLREIPAVGFLGVWIGVQIWQGGVGLLRPSSTGGVAVFAHIGGFAFGLLTVYLVAKRRPLRPTY